MLESYHYAYLTGATLFAIPWLVIYLFRPDLRREMLIMSALNGIYGLTEHFYYGEYWHPILAFKVPGLNAGLESIYLMVVYGGLAAAIYKVVFHRKVVQSQSLTLKRGALVVVVIGISEF